MQSVNAKAFAPEAEYILDNGGAMDKAANVSGLEILYKPFWIFVIGSVAGFFFETAYCLIRKSTFEYRSSLVFVPFTAIYGLGAMLLYLGTSRIKKTNTIMIFSFGLVAGTAIEFFCSYFQEKLFGTVSWDYSQSFLNLGGRVCLRLSAMWGLLAIVWVIGIQPLFETVIAKIPARLYKPLTQALFVFLMINAAISFAAVSRWVIRIDGVPALGPLSQALDRFFPDAFMYKVYPNMMFRG